MHTFLAVFFCYLAVNFFVALLLHVHALRQAHLPPRFLDVLMHFLLFTAIAVPVLLVTSAEAFFGRGEPMRPGGYGPVVHHR